MPRLLLSVILLIMFSPVFGQINMKDSTVQVIGFWDKNEKQTYKLSQCKYKIVNNDTISRDTASSEVYITVIDSTTNSYTIEWLYKNIKTNDKLPVMRKLAALAENIRVVVKTSELGEFQGIMNWEEVAGQVKSILNQIKPELTNIPGGDKVLDQIASIYSTKEAIENSAYKEIPLFYAFHGGRYKLQEEMHGKVKLPNILGGEQFDGDMTVWLDEIMPGDDENYSILRAIQTTDKEQLTTAVTKFIADLGKNMGTDIPLKEEDFKDLKNNVEIGMSIHNGGWPIYGMQTTEVSMQGTTAISVLSFEIQ
jgi:hypothetical protein